MALASLALQACNKSRIEDVLEKTSWLEDGGTRTIVFERKQVIVNGTELCQKGQTLFVEGGQIWIEEDGNSYYKYDYKISGVNLFVGVDTTNVFNDPSSPSNSSGVKYKPN